MKTGTGRLGFWVVALVMVLMAVAGSAVAAEGEGGEIEAVKLIGAWVDAGAPEKEPFTFTAKDGKEYEATFEADVLPLFTQANVWAENTGACNTCHNAVSEDSAHEMDMGTYEGIMLGADSVSGDAVPIVKPGDWAGSKLKERLRNNRMPPGMPFDVTEANRDGPVVKAKSGGELEAVKLIGAWVDAGAPEKDAFKFTGTDGKEYEATFEADVLPLFTQANVWAENTGACNTCHNAVSEDSAHEMDMGTYEGIMLGADSVSGDAVPIIKPGDWAGSKLRARLRDNRMPPGMPFDVSEANRDGPVVKAGKPVAAEAPPTEETTKPAETLPAPAPASGGGNSVLWVVVVAAAVVVVVVALRSRSK